MTTDKCQFMGFLGTFTGPSFEFANFMRAHGLNFNVHTQ